MNNQKYFEILVNTVRVRYIKKYTRQDEDYELGEADIRKLKTAIENYLDATLKVPKEREYLGTDMGFDILKQIYKGTYMVSNSIHERKEKTLTKLAMFLGYSNWDDFKKFAYGTQARNELEEELHRTILSSKNVEFNIYLRLKLDVTELTKYFSFSDDSHEVFQIKQRVNEALDKGISISQGDGSVFEVFKPHLLEVRNSQALIEVEEYWWLDWRDRNEVSHRQVIRDKFVYLLINQRNQWKIHSKMNSPNKRISVSIKS